METQGQSSNIIFDDPRSFYDLADGVVSYFVAVNEGIPAEIEDLIKRRFLTFTGAPMQNLKDVVDQEIEKRDVKELLKLWLDKQTASKAVVKKFLKDALIIDTGNPYVILKLAKVPEEQIPKILDLDNCPQEKEAQMEQSVASMSLAIAIIRGFMIMGKHEDVETPVDVASIEMIHFEECAVSEVEVLRKQNAILTRQVEQLTKQMAGITGLGNFAGGIVSSAKDHLDTGKKIRKTVDKRKAQLGLDGEVSDLSDEEMNTYVMEYDDVEMGSKHGSIAGSIIASKSERIELLVTIQESTDIKASGVPTDITYLISQIESESGLLYINVRGDIYKIKKVKSKESSPGMFKLSLLSANYRSPTSLAFGGRPPQYFLPSNTIQFAAQIEEHLLMLDADQNDTSVVAAALKKGIDISARKANVQSYYRQMRTLLASHMSTGSSQKLPVDHVRTWALFAQFHYLFFSNAMACNRDVLLKEAVAVWTTHYERKIISIKYDISIREAASFLGYGCSKCRRGGMLDNYCLVCNREEVSSLLKGRTKTSDSENFDARYEKWVKEREAKGLKDPAENTKKKFRATTKAPEKASPSSKVITQEEYFQYLTDNQHLFELIMPSKFYLNR